MMESDLDLAGVVTGAVTPFGINGDIDWSSMDRHIASLKGTGLKGVLANAMMAEGLHLSRSERENALRFVVKEVGDELPVIATVYGVNTQDAADEALCAAKAGARALLVFPHPAFGGQPLDPTIPVAYFRAIYERAGLPIIVFRMPAGSAPMLGLEVIQRLADEPGIFGMKDSVAEGSFYEGEGAALLATDTPIRIFIDSDPVMLDYARRGVYGAMSLCAAVLPRSYAYLFANAQEVGIDRFAQEIGAFAEIVFRAPKRDFRARLKKALQVSDILSHALVRAPLPQLTGKEEMEIVELLPRLTRLEHELNV